MKKLLLTSAVALSLVSGSAFSQGVDSYEGWGNFNKVTITPYDSNKNVVLDCPSGKYYHSSAGNYSDELGVCPTNSTNEKFVKEGSWLIANYAWSGMGTKTYIGENCSLVQNKRLKITQWKCKELKELKDRYSEFSTSNVKTIKNSKKKYPFSSSIDGAGW